MNNNNNNHNNSNNNNHNHNNTTTIITSIVIILMNYTCHVVNPNQTTPTLTLNLSRKLTQTSPSNSHPNLLRSTGYQAPTSNPYSNPNP